MKQKNSKKTDIWGLTGGIASGKSTAGRIFSTLGIPVIDADKIAKELTAEGSPLQKAIFQRFGTQDRAQLREIIFSDAEAKKELEAILHPQIEIESKKQMETLARHHSVILYEATLLIETGRYKNFSGLITVEAHETIRIQRLIARDSITREMAERIIRAQMSDSERRKYSTMILDNSSSISSLENQIQGIIQTLRK